MTVFDLRPQLVICAPQDGSAAYLCSSTLKWVAWTVFNNSYANPYLVLAYIHALVSSQGVSLLSLSIKVDMRPKVDDEPHEGVRAAASIG